MAIMNSTLQTNLPFIKIEMNIILYNSTSMSEPLSQSSPQQRKQSTAAIEEPTSQINSHQDCFPLNNFQSSSKQFKNQSSLFRQKQTTQKQSRAQLEFQNSLQQKQQTIDQIPENSLLSKMMASIQLQNPQIDVSDTLINAIIDLTQSVYFLKKSMSHIEQRINYYAQLKEPSEPKRKRRRAAELDKTYVVLVGINRQCPFDTCLKGYASDISLNLHIRLKHKTKDEEERELKNAQRERKKDHLEIRKNTLQGETPIVQSKFQLPGHIKKCIQNEYQKLIGNTL